MDHNLLTSIAKASSLSQVKLLLAIHSSEKERVTAELVTARNVEEILELVIRKLRYAIGSGNEQEAIDSFETFISLISEDERFNNAATTIRFAKDVKSKIKYADISTSRKSIVELQMLSKLLLAVCKNLYKKIRE